MTVRAVDDKVFIGRRDVMAVLQDAFGKMLNGNGSCIFIAGESGIGKTALVKRFFQQGIQIADQWAQDSRRQKEWEVRFEEVHCTDVTDTRQAFAPFQQTLEQLIKRTSNRSVRYLERIAPMLLQAVPYAGSALSEALKVSMEELRATRPEWTYDPVRPESRVDQYVDILTGFADELPLVVFIDDLQWADPYSINVILSLSRLIDRHPFLLIAAYRPVDVRTTVQGEPHPLPPTLTEIHRYGNALELTLKEFTELEIVQYLKAAYPGLETHLNFTTWLHEHTGGAPFYVKEVLKFLVTSGQIYEVPGNWRVRPNFQRDAVPGTVQKVIEKRISALDDFSRKLLRYASVQGVSFRSRVLSEVVEINRLKVLEYLDKLKNTYELIMESPAYNPVSLQADWQFAHKLIHLVAYETSSQPLRVELHHSVAEVLQQLFSENAEEIAGELAVHYEHAKRFSEALNYRIIAASQAFWNRSHTEVVRHVDAALDDLHHINSGQEFSSARQKLLLLSAASRCEQYRDLEIAKEHAEEAFKIADSMSDVRGMIASYVYHYLARERLHDDLASNDRFLADHQKAWDLASRIDALRPLAHCTTVHLSLRAHLALELTQEQLEEALRRAQAHGDRITETIITKNQAMVAQQIGNEKQAVKLYSQVLALMDEEDTEEWTRYRREEWVFFEAPHNVKIFVLEQLGNMHRWRYEWQKAIRYYAKVVDIADQAGAAETKAGLLNLIAVCALTAGDIGDAKKAIDNALPIVRKLAVESLSEMILNTAILIALCQRDLETSQTLISEYEAVVERWEDHRSARNSRRYRALSAFLRGEWNVAHDILAQLIALTGDSEDVWRYYLDQALVLYRLFRHKEARRCAVTSLIGEAQDTATTIEAHFLLERLATDTGRSRIAQYHNQRAVRLLQELKIKRDRSRPESWIV